MTILKLNAAGVLVVDTITQCCTACGGNSSVSPPENTPAETPPDPIPDALTEAEATPDNPTDDNDEVADDDTPHD